MAGDTFRLVTLIIVSMVPVAMCVSLVTGRRTRKPTMTKEELIEAMYDGEVTVISPPDPLLLAACSLVPRKGSTVPPAPVQDDDEGR